MQRGLRCCDQTNELNVQGIFCNEEGTKKHNVHVQAAWAQPFATSPNMHKDLRALLRIICNFKSGAAKLWNVVVVCHPEEPGLQPQLSKVTRAGLFGYCCKQRHDSPTFRCELPHTSR
jgi:hypothetical protein